MWPERHFILISLVYRFLNCCLVQTSFVPDEYWQSLEPAHRLVFGCGGLSWEWSEGLRSYVHPLVFAFLYEILFIFHLDSRFFIVHVPRLAQSLLAVVADIYLYKFTKKLYGEKVALWTLVCYWLNWFTFFCTPRTLANTTEAQLTIIALYYYPWPQDSLFDKGKQDSHALPSIYLAVVALATIIRPTCAVFWLPLCLLHFLRSEHKIGFILRTVVPATLPVLVLSVICDRICYGTIVVSLWRFLKFNVLQGGSAHFGVHPWHWYFTNCLPTIGFTHSTIIACGIYETKDYMLALLCTFYIVIHSFLSHKELRFLLPLLAPLCIYAGRYMDIVYRRWSSSYKSEDEKVISNSIKDYIGRSPKGVKTLVIFLFITNFPIMIYTGLFHQRGVLDVVKYLHDESIAYKNMNLNVSAWFLTPCYTSPACSHTHLPIPVRMLECTPNLTGIPNYVEEADEFHTNPIEWINREFITYANALPTHIVLYEPLWTQSIQGRLQAYNFRLCARFYNTNFPQSERQSNYLVVACRK